MANGHDFSEFEQFQTFLKISTFSCTKVQRYLANKKCCSISATDLSSKARIELLPFKLQSLPLDGQLRIRNCTEIEHVKIVIHSDNERRIKRFWRNIARQHETFKIVEVNRLTYRGYMIELKTFPKR